MRRKAVALFITCVMTGTMAACGTGGDAGTSQEGGSSGSNVKLEMCIGGEIDQDSQKVLNALIDEYTEETGVEVEVVASGNDHESVMKTRMASNDMPDIWSTHGWAVLRYGDYALDLADQDWVGNMDEAVKSVVTDGDGKVDACPLTEWTYGIVYDEQVFSDNGIEPYSLKTMDDLFAACEKLKEAGVTPFTTGAKDGQPFAGMMEMMNSFYTIDGAPYASNDQLKDGTFDWSENTQILELMADIFDNGWLNEDIFTADNTTSLKQLGTGEYAMRLWGGPTEIASLSRYFPDRSYGLIPIPAVEEGGSQVYTVGEGTSFAISKNSEHQEECLELLSFLVESENLAQYAAVNGGLPGLKGIELEDNNSLEAYNKSVEEAGDSLQYSNFFDREYMPSGMWNAMQEAGAKLYNGDVGTAKDRISEAAEYLQENYDTLYESSGNQ